MKKQMDVYKVPWALSTTEKRHQPPSLRIHGFDRLVVVAG